MNRADTAQSDISRNLLPPVTSMTIDTTECNKLSEVLKRFRFLTYIPSRITELPTAKGRDSACDR